MTTMLKPPGTKHLKLKFDILLSTSAFRINLRCYMKGACARSMWSHYQARYPELR
jgi:hypothetical protein